MFFGYLENKITLLHNDVTVLIFNMIDYQEVVLIF